MLIRSVKRAAGVAVLCLATVLAVRAWDSQRGRPLDPWHTFVPDELTPAEIDRSDWAAYLSAEEALFGAVRSRVTAKLAPDVQVPINRYFDGSPIYPGRFERDWNRSFVLEPDPAEDFGIRLGSVGLRGEQGALILGLDTLMRMASNPFFPYSVERIEEAIRADASDDADAL